jgi:hypothetical protein
LVHRPICRDHEIGLQPLAMRGEEIGDERAADFLLAFEQENDVAGQFPMRLQVSKQLRKVLALVVADPARIDAPVADGRLSKGGLSQASSGSGGCTS